MVVQRRYSVTGQTPPDHVDVDVGPMKPQHSPKLQALDTSVQTTSCGLCEGAVAAADPSAKSSTAPSTTAAIRTSSKRSATQLPSPNTPSSHQLPTKIARLGLEHHDMDVDEGALTDPFPEEESDWALSSFASSSASIPSSPEYSPPTSLPDETIVESLDLCQDSSDHLALSPPPQPPAKLLYSIANTHLDQESEPNQCWDHDFSLLSDMPYQAAHHQHHEQHLAHSNSPVARSDSPLREHDTPQLTATLLTLPPELRHHIYLHLPDLVLPYPLIYCLSTFANNMQHPLASVSRLIRSEALAIFYSYNSWIIKLEFKMMYEAFQDWIIRLGDGAGLLRLVTVAVRGSLFKPKTSHASSVVVNGQLIHIPGGVPASNNQSDEQYHPPDGDASFRIDLSEKYPGGKVELVRNDGTVEAGEKAMGHLTMLVRGLWEKRRAGTLNGQDWVNMVDNFLGFTGWW